jgi:hypothetical protein
MTIGSDQCVIISTLARPRERSSPDEISTPYKLLEKSRSLAASDAIQSGYQEQMGIPVKVNAYSGGKPNGVPERR